MTEGLEMSNRVTLSNVTTMSVGTLGGREPRDPLCGPGLR